MSWRHYHYECHGKLFFLNNYFYVKSIHKSCNNYLRILSLISNTICWAILFSPKLMICRIFFLLLFVWCGNFCVNQYYSFGFLFSLYCLAKSRLVLFGVLRLFGLCLNGSVCRSHCSNRHTGSSTYVNSCVLSTLQTAKIRCMCLSEKDLRSHL